MASNLSLHSNAMNFLSFMKSGVDPRTGQYTLAITLPDLYGNAQLEHPLKLQLSFNPLNQGDSGYGTGWNLNLSQYMAGNQVLSLSSGESFRLEDSASGQQLVVREQKLPSFNVYKQGKHNLDKVRRLRIMHRSGWVEILEFQGWLEGQPSRGVALPVELHSPQGHKLYLTYKHFVAEHYIIETIKDGDGELLFQCARSNSQVAFLLHPLADAGAQPLARYSMELEGTDNWVRQITLPGEPAGKWEFTYRLVQGHLCLDTIYTPTGAIEQLFYQDNGHAFPHDKSKYLPRVTRHLTEPRFEQKPIDVRFTYGFEDQNGTYRQHSFIGSGTNIGWDDSGRDNLYEYLGDYEYRSEEQLWVDEQLVRSIERRFNRIHLQTAEITRQGNSLFELLTEYPAMGERHFRDLPAICQLPLKETRRWRLLDNSRPSRSEHVETTYDNHGNPRIRKLANGVVEQYQWYPADGEEGCPADPEGFVRHLKEKITTPAPEQEAGALPQCERYRYQTLPRLKDPAHEEGNPDHDWHKQAWHAVRRETLIEQGTTEQVLRVIHHYYANSAADPFLHGRLYLQQQICNGLQTTTEWHYDRVDGPGLDKTVLQTEKVLLGYDDTRRSTLDQRSLFHGKQLLVRDANGVDTHFEYDRLLRVTQETVAPGSKFRATRQYAYTLYSGTGTQATQTITNARGIKTITLLDGLARVVSEARSNVYEGYPERLHTTHVIRYDGRGQRASETRYDWLNSQGERALTQHFEYDDWGEPCCTIGPIGVDDAQISAKAVRAYQEVDPLGSREHPNGPLITTWLQVGTGKDAQVSDWSQTWQNLFEKPQRMLALDDKGEQVTLRTYAYDGLGNCTREVDERNYSTHHSYDGFGRLTSTLLPDRTRIERSYARHTQAELATSIWVFPVNSNEPSSEIGLRHYDGLDRLSITRTGPRTEHWRYHQGETQPREHINAAGVSTLFDYELALTTEPTATTTVEGRDTFAFNDVSARLTNANNTDSGRSYDYNLANQVIAEHWHDRPSGTQKSRKYVSSLDDRLLETKNEADTIVTRSTYDSYGRVQTTEQGALEVRHEYDDFGRQWRTTTLDRSSNSSLQTLFTYDHRSREICRTWNQNGLAQRKQTQEWGPDNLLKRRQLSEGDHALLEETFAYDARSRLNNHACTGPQAPRNELGRPIKSQIFTLDAYDNISLTVTQYADDSPMERARYFHAANDPCQLRRIEYTPARTSGNPTFNYDANGNLLKDERGQTLSYDSRNRLLSVEASRYRYDGFGHLLARMDASGSETVLLFEGNRLHLAIRGGVENLYCYHGDWPLGQQSNDGQPPLLWQTSASHSVIAESLAADRREASYSAYGAHPYVQDKPLRGGLGYNGEALEADSGWYLLGNGYRAYNPVLMRFHSPDALSPFDDGGLNCYAYCLGNPINLRDPTGHTAIGWSGRLREVYEDDPNKGAGAGGGGTPWDWIGAGLGVVFSFLAITVATVATYGAASPLYAALGKGTAAMAAAFSAAKVTKAAVAITVAALTVTSTAYGFDAVANQNPESSKISMMTGIAATVLSLGYGVVSGVKSLPKLARLIPKPVRNAFKGMGRVIPRSVLSKFHQALRNRTGFYDVAATEVASNNQRFGELNNFLPSSTGSQAAIQTPLDNLEMHTRELIEAQFNDIASICTSRL
ncbi:RHS repeat-associated core domain-containing protein [Pseudomonas sp.]|uniref:RHS repeat domain-containing protein n=1 Tax=Pseudomonas sp. TaxID=306 RepID=UPI001B0F186F|nr:RHS repeat-associated core domain-containing protein [Pseudomonas sp.]MBO9549825.1 sugar-binding protein [Pseudomonas sp.]